MIALVIDGPKCGDLIETTSMRYVAVTIPNNHKVNLVQTPYYIHAFNLCGRIINIASIKLLVEDISPGDAFNALASDKAKRAARL